MLKLAALAFSAFLVVAVLTVSACGGSDGDATSTTVSRSPTTSTENGNLPAKLTTVTISDNKFTPGSLQVPVGATVTWNWTGVGRHSVKGTFDGEPIESPVLSGTGVYLWAFQKAGVFEYECGIHGAAMKGTITIQ